jgi:hypothetical protein
MHTVQQRILADLVDGIPQKIAAAKLFPLHRINCGAKTGIMYGDGFAEQEELQIAATEAAEGIHVSVSACLQAQCAAEVSDRSATPTIL